MEPVPPDNAKVLNAWRKEPRQARSAATVRAILEATVQVIAQGGAARLTTTCVAARAGVSVGTMYQYFPNKRALMLALFQRHMEAVATTIESACELHVAQPLDAIADALVSGFMQVMSSRPDESSAAFLVAVEAESAGLLRAMSDRVAIAVARLLSSAEDARFADLASVALTVTGTLAGAARSLIEHGLEPASVLAQRAQLTLMMRGYLRLAAQTG